jgi:hypothetical protein
VTDVAVLWRATVPVVGSTTRLLGQDSNLQPSG